MREKHEAILKLLLEKRKMNPDLTFSLRRTNRYQRLEKGYWFYGNEHYLVVSFWTGMDWRNKTPNIFFSVSEEGETSLDMVSADKDGKWVFLKKIIDDTELEGLDSSAKSLHKDYSENGTDFIASLDLFLSGDKQIIDEFVKENSKGFFTTETKGDPIGFIKKEEFEKRLTKTKGYRENLTEELEKGPTIWLDNFKIEGYGAIQNIEIKDLPSRANMIFITGLNGTGKTTILKALTIAALENKTESGTPIETKPFKISAEFKSKSGEFDKIFPLTKGAKEIQHPGFAAYGASRLGIDGEQEIFLVDKIDGSRSDLHTKSKQKHYNIFSEYGILRNIKEFKDQIALNIKEGVDFDLEAQARIDAVIETLTSVIHRLNRIEYPHLTMSSLWEEIIFFEQDENGEPFKTGVSLVDMASGMKSLIGMVGDMLLRMFEQQPNIEDPSEFIGTILIDEIDIHLHPILQRKLVEELYTSFPKIQFIVSTHSPIPLLGAPKDSVIFTVTRDQVNGVKLTRVDEKVMFERILPNAILNSPIFGMEDLIPSAKADEESLLPEDEFNEALLQEKLEEDIENFMTNKQEKDLIELFKNK